MKILLIIVLMILLLRVLSFLLLLTILEFYSLMFRFLRALLKVLPVVVSKMVVYLLVVK